MNSSGQSRSHASMTKTSPLGSYGKSLQFLYSKISFESLDSMEKYKGGLNKSTRNSLV